MKRFAVNFLAVVGGLVVGLASVATIFPEAWAQVAPRRPQFAAATHVTDLTVDEEANIFELVLGSGGCTGCGGATPGGMDGDVQYNEGGTLGGVPLVYDPMTESLTFTESSVITFDGANGEVIVTTGVFDDVLTQNLETLMGTDTLNVQPSGETAFNDVTINGTCTGCGGGTTWTTGTFEAVWDTACTTSPSQTINFSTDGETVILQPIDNVSCTGDSTNFLATTALPAELRPTNRRVAGIFEAVDNAVGTGACWLIEPTGDIQAIDIGTTINWCTDSSTTNWQATGARSLSGLTAGGLVYMLTN